MRVFLSWSGERSSELARALQEFLKNVLPSLDAWLSEDIATGDRWNDVLVGKLETSDFGVLCLTPENLDAPWILFEAGALAARFALPKVAPYCLGLTPADISYPLGQFMGVPADKGGTDKLARALNAMLEQPLDETRLCSALAAYWPTLQAKIESLLASADQHEASAVRAEVAAERRSMAAFSSRLAGPWWERVRKKGLGFFQILPDTFHSSVKMEGRFYDLEGGYEAHWYSAAVQVVKTEQKIVYVRRCFNPSRQTETWFHGFGEMWFEGSAGQFTRGGGSFYDILTEKNETVKLMVDLRRLADGEFSVMGKERSENEYRDVVVEALRKW